MIACYSRVSTQEQALHGNSIEEQIDRMGKYCDAMNWSPVRFYTDAGASGASLDRPSLQSLVRDVCDGKISKVLVYKLDRLSRSQKDTLYLIEDVFLKHGTDFVSMSENFDTSSAFGIAMIGILSVFAQLEREQIKERMTMGRLGRAKRGLYIGSGIVPIGYDYQDGKLSVNASEASQIKRIFDLYATGMTPQAIAKDLNSKGLHHRYGEWRYKTIRDIIDRRLYLGQVSFAGQWHDGLHEPIITQEQWDKAQRMREKVRQDYELHNRKRGKSASYLGGLLECGQCGQKYWLVKTHNKGRSYDYYECNGRARSHNCHNKIWRMADLDSIIFDEIRKLSTDPVQNDHDDLRPILQNELDKVTAQIDRLVDLYALGDISIETIQSRVQELDQRRKLLLNELEQSQRPLEDAETIISGFGEALELGDFTQIRELLTALIDRITLDGEDITIHWNFY